MASRPDAIRVDFNLDRPRDSLPQLAEIEVPVTFRPVNLKLGR